MRRALATGSLLVVGLAVGYGARSLQSSRKTELNATPVKVVATSSGLPAPPLRSPNARDLKPSEVRWFLNETRIPDFAEELSHSSGLRARDRRIEGCFSGAVRLIDSREWEMKTDIEIQSENPLSGNVSVQLRENGTLFSNSSGSGELSDLRSLREPSEAILIEASDTRYFQMYPTADGSMLVGNLYVRGSDPRDFEFKGTARLKRIGCEE